MNINHAEYQKKIRKISDEALRFTIEDCQEALRIFPDNPKAGYYQDEIHYCLMELNRRAENARCGKKR